MAVDQRELALERVRPAVEQDLAVRWQRRLGRVDAANQEPGRAQPGERREALPSRWSGRPGGRVRGSAAAAAAVSSTQCQSSPARCVQPGRSSRSRGTPAVAQARRRGARDALREGVRGVDDGRDALLAQPARRALGSSEAAHAHLALRQSRRCDAARERRDHARAVSGERAGERAGLGGAPSTSTRHGDDGRSRAAE